MLRPWKGVVDLRTFAPPFPNELAFYCRFFEDVSSFRDELNHPLHEVDFRSEQPTSEYRTCPYPGGRKGFPMNQRALSEVLNVWAEITADLRAIVTFDGIGATADIRRVWKRSLIPMFLPLYFRMSSQGDKIPLRMSALFKVMLDLPTTLDLMIPSRSIEQNSPFHPQDVVEFAESSSILINQHWVCAGSVKMISEMTSILFGLDYPVTELRLETASTLRVDETLIGFTDVMTIQYASNIIFQICNLILMEIAFRFVSQSGGNDYEVDGESSAPNSAYETRRQIMLSLVGDAEACEKVVRAFEDSATFEFDRSNTNLATNLHRFCDRAVTLINEASQSCQPETIFALVYAFLEEWKLILNNCQISARRIVKAPDIWFKNSLNFLSDSRLPLNVLESFISSRGDSDPKFI